MLRLDDILHRRDAVAENYNHALGAIPQLILPPVTLPAGRLSWFVYVVRLAPDLERTHRDEIVARMRDSGIQCGRYFAPIHSQPAYVSIPIRHPLPVTESASERTIALPFFTAMTRQQGDIVAQTLADIIKPISPLR